MNVADILEKAADLIEPEGAWTQGCAARAPDGAKVSFDDEGAACWCALGAIWRTAGDMWSGPVIDAEMALLKANDDRGTGNWNDAPERTQAEVVAKLREAAALARQDASHG